MRLITAVFMTIAMGAAAPVAAAHSKGILLLHTYGADTPGRFPFDTEFARVVREAGNDEVDLYIETIDPNRFGGARQLRQTRQYLREKYADKKIAAVVTVFDEALVFLLDERDPLFPSVPVAAFMLARPPPLPDRVTVIYTGSFIRDSVSLALRLNPQARHIAVIDGLPPGATGRNAAHDEVTSEINALGPRLPVRVLDNLPLDELLAEVQALPPDGIIVFSRHYLGPGGRPISRADAAREVARVAPAPVYVTSDQLIGFGAIGGTVVRIENEATDLAKLALRISDNPGLRIPPAQASRVPIFDWRELRRWGIDERRLPPGSEIRFHVPGIWDQYRWYVIVAVGMAVVQSALIVGLVVQRRRRRRIEVALRESEQHFRLMADTTPVMIWRCGPDRKMDFFNKPWLDFRGRTLDQEKGFGWKDGLHPDDRTRWIQARTAAFEAREVFHLEYRLQRADGEYRWILEAGVPRYDETGQFTGYIGSSIDITARRRTEEQNQALTGRMIHVQEEERTRIARDLHDDVSQQLAGLAIMLSALKRKIGKPGAQPDVDRTVTALQERMSGVAETVRTLSHDLHPSVLKHAGLVATLRRHCADIEEHQGIKVIFTAENQFNALVPEVSLCLFRVAQEALINVVRHARAHTIRVQLLATHEGVELRVDDNGIGFVVDERMDHGLGLRSITERVRLVQGHVQVDSRPGRGTMLLVRVPTPVVPVALNNVS